MQCICKTYPCANCGKQAEAQKHFYIKFSGAAWNIIADTPEAAWQQIKDHLHVYCTPNVKEIGKDCDENGYDFPKDDGNWEVTNELHPGSKSLKLKKDTVQ